MLPCIWSRELLIEAAGRCVAVAGDLRMSAAALREAISEPLTYVWHCGASLRYLERDRFEIEDTNVGGTAALLTATRVLGAERFHYVSTAFVVGERTGRLLEAPVTEVGRRNVYEETKVRAEQLVLAAEGSGFHTTVLRPSVVVGHSRTGAVSGTLTGMYGLWRQLDRARPAPADGGPWRLHVDPQATINIVPVDSVAADAVACGLSPSVERVFHLTAHEPTGFADIVRVFCERTGRTEPEYVPDGVPLDRPWTHAEERLHRAIGFYATYLEGDKRFIRTHTDSVVGMAAARQATEIDKVRLEALCDWYVREHVAGGR